MKILRFAAPLLALVPAVAFAAAPRTLQELAYAVVTILNNLTTVLIVVGIVVYFYGISTNIFKFGDDGMEKVRSYFLWGVVVLFVMVSIWGILRLLQDTLFGGTQAIDSAQTTQTSSDGFRPVFK